MKKLAKLIGLLLINIIVIAVLLEILLRLTAPVLPGAAGIAARWVTSGKPYAEEWTPAWQQNREHYWALRRGLDNVLQYGSPSVSFYLSTAELWEGGGIGFRATVPIDYEVHSVVVGDSFGMCFTERTDCWVEQLASNTGLNIVNLSQPVTGTTSHLRILHDFGQPLHPPLVIWQFFGNDFNDDYGLAVFRDDIESLEPEATQSTEPRGWSALYAVLETLITGRFSGVPDSESAFVKPYRATYGVNNENVMLFGGAYELQALDMSREQNQIGYDLSRQAFIQAQSLVAEWDGELVIVIIPTREEVYADVTAPVMGAAEITRLQSARDAMHTLCTDLSLQCFDLYEVFQQHAANGEALYYDDDMHLNPYGNTILAEALADWLAQQGMAEQN
jgi:hypothetical protein